MYDCAMILRHSDESTFCWCKNSVDKVPENGSNRTGLKRLQEVEVSKGQT